MTIKNETLFLMKEYMNRTIKTVLLGVMMISSCALLGSSHDVVDVAALKSSAESEINKAVSQAKWSFLSAAWNNPGQTATFTFLGLGAVFSGGNALWAAPLHTKSFIAFSGALFWGAWYKIIGNKVQENREMHQKTQQEIEKLSVAVCDLKKGIKAGFEQVEQDAQERHRKALAIAKSQHDRLTANIIGASGEQKQAIAKLGGIITRMSRKVAAFDRRLAKLEKQGEKNARALQNANTGIAALGEGQQRTQAQLATLQQQADEEAARRAAADDERRKEAAATQEHFGTLHQGLAAIARRGDANHTLLLKHGRQLQQQNNIFNALVLQGLAQQQVINTVFPGVKIALVRDDGSAVLLNNATRSLVNDGVVAFEQTNTLVGDAGIISGLAKQNMIDMAGEQYQGLNHHSEDEESDRAGMHTGQSLPRHRSAPTPGRFLTHTPRSPGDRKSSS